MENRRIRISVDKLKQINTKVIKFEGSIESAKLMSLLALIVSLASLALHLI
jgi:hypothetical protein